MYACVVRVCVRFWTRLRMSVRACVRVYACMIIILYYIILYYIILYYIIMWAQCEHTSVRTCVYVRAFKRIWVRIYVRVCVSVRECVCECARIRVRMCACVRDCMCVRVWARVWARLRV